MTCNVLIPNWPHIKNIRAYSTTKHGGISKNTYAFLNLGDHVGDIEADVLKNRSILHEELKMPSNPFWLNQTHSAICVNIDESKNNNADAAITANKGKILAVMTADCLPILLCAKNGLEIAAIHAGWRGLCNGVIENTLTKMRSPKNEIMAWFGPTICGNCYEVGHDVYDLFMLQYNDLGFVKYNNKWLLNTKKIARHILEKHNISAIYSCERCTFEEKEHFFSYRRDVCSQKFGLQQGVTGRMATLIWME